MNDVKKAEYFDSIAGQWDGWQDPSDRLRMLTALDHFGVEPGETVLDLGCGTGNLTRVLLERLSPAGRVVAVDVSPRMLETAKAKIQDDRVAWHVADAHSLPLASASVDRVIAYSVWPHLRTPAAVATELRRVLRLRGHLHVWHLISRARVNEIHAGAAECIRKDHLPPATVTARLLEGAGYAVVECEDDERGYLVSARVAESG